MNIIMPANTQLNVKLSQPVQPSENRQQPTSNCLLNPSLSLRRPNSYRAQNKKVQPEEEEKKKNTNSFLNRLRSKSSPNIHNSFNQLVTASIEIIENKCNSKSRVYEPIKSRVDEPLKDSAKACNNNITDSSSFKSIQKSVPLSDAARKKSVGSVLGFSDVKELKIRRSNSAKSPSKKLCDSKKNNRLTLNDASMNCYDVPMFPATTLFVPGYDFETGQKISITDSPRLGRKQSSPVLHLRRGSREKTLMQLPSPKSNRNTSCPSRDSKETTNEVKTFSPSLGRRGSLPRYFPVLLKRNSKEKICVSVHQQEENINHISKDNTDSNSRSFIVPLPASSEELEECVRNFDLNDRKKLLSKNQEKFVQKKKGDKIEDDVPYEHVSGKVKHISSAFEEGIPFQEDTSNCNSLVRAKSLPSKYRYDGKTCVERLANRKKKLSDINKPDVEFSRNFEWNYITNIEKKETYKNRDHRQLCQSKPELNVIVPSPTLKSYFHEDALSNSWPTIQDPTTDLCVTEL